MRRAGRGPSIRVKVDIGLATGKLEAFAAHCLLVRCFSVTLCWSTLLVVTAGFVSISRFARIGLIVFISVVVLAIVLANAVRPNTAGPGRVTTSTRAPSSGVIASCQAMPASLSEASKASCNQCSNFRNSQAIGRPTCESEGFLHDA